MLDVFASNVSFKTRYALTPIDSETGLSSGATVHVLNMVLDSGLKALGTAIAYSSVSLGTSRLTADPVQTGLINPVAKVDLTQSGITHQNVSTADGIISTVTHEVIFKTITFPSSEREININEVGLTGLTRAVLDEPLVIGLKDWVAVSVIIEYKYNALLNGTFLTTVNGVVSDTDAIKYSVEPIIVNNLPDNRTGRGWGAIGVVPCKLWDGKPITGDFVADSITGITISSKLDSANNQWRYVMTGDYNALAKVKGLTIHDTINGVVNLIKFTEPLSFEEDDTVELTFTFKWSR